MKKQTPTVTENKTDKGEYLLNPVLLWLGFITSLGAFLLMASKQNNGDWDSTTWWMLVIAILFIPSKSFGSWIRKQYNSIVATVGSLVVLLFYLAIAIGVIWLGYKGVAWGVDQFRPKSWTLFLYSSPRPNTDYQTSKIEGYSRKTECLEKGLTLKKNGSFECGYDCRYRDEYLMSICGKVCDSGGCRD